ncbi:MAG TPA: cytochrome c [Xanthomonadales bacterium]|nr:cytochrome c [Xanthomonadales bacterium]
MQLNVPSMLALAAAIVAVSAGCTKSENSTASGSGTTAPSADAAVIAVGDADRGGEVFRGNCSRCHGATGTEGGVGPALAHESSRKNYQQTVAWIENPLPPMPKLYPKPLTERAVRDVAAYVQKL